MTAVKNLQIWNLIGFLLLFIHLIYSLGDQIKKHVYFSQAF